MKATTLLMSLLVINLMAIAQPTPEMERRMERMEAARVAMLTTELELTTAEAEKFWPVYNEMRSKIKNLVKERHQVMQQMEAGGSLSLEEREAMVLANFERDKALANIKQQYHQKFKDIIGLEKTLKLHEAEHKMQRKMVKHMREGEKGGKGGGQRQGQR
jgi:transposase